jgi:hypothetical protein
MQGNGGMALDGGKWSASRSGRFTLRERAPGTHWIGDWVGPRAGLDTVKQKYLVSAGTRTTAVQTVARRYTDFLLLHFMPFSYYYLKS